VNNISCILFPSNRFVTIKTSGKKDGRGGTEELEIKRILIQIKIHVKNDSALKMVPSRDFLASLTLPAVKKSPMEAHP